LGVLHCGGFPHSGSQGNKQQWRGRSYYAHRQRGLFCYLGLGDTGDTMPKFPSGSKEWRKTRWRSCCYFVSENQFQLSAELSGWCLLWIQASCWRTLQEAPFGSHWLCAAVWKLLGAFTTLSAGAAWATFSTHSWCNHNKERRTNHKEFTPTPQLPQISVFWSLLCWSWLTKLDSCSFGLLRNCSRWSKKLETEGMLLAKLFLLCLKGQHRSFLRACTAHTLSLQLLLTFAQQLKEKWRSRGSQRNPLSWFLQLQASEESAGSVESL